MGRSTGLSVRSKNKTLAGPPQGMAGPFVPPEDDRTIFFAGSVDEGIVTSAAAYLQVLSNRDHQRPIRVLINTYGGSADDMFALYDYIRFVPAPIYTIGIGKIMSAGVLLLASGAKGHRVIAPNARIMIHPVSSGVLGTVWEQETAIKETRRLQEQWQREMAANTNMTIEQITELMETNVDTYITPEQAVAYGIVDKVMSTKWDK